MTHRRSYTADDLGPLFDRFKERYSKATTPRQRLEALEEVHVALVRLDWNTLDEEQYYGAVQQAKAAVNREVGEILDEHPELRELARWLVGLSPKPSDEYLESLGS